MTTLTLRLALLLNFCHALHNVLPNFSIYLSVFSHTFYPKYCQVIFSSLTNFVSFMSIILPATRKFFFPQYNYFKPDMTNSWNWWSDYTVLNLLCKFKRVFSLFSNRDNSSMELFSPFKRKTKANFPFLSFISHSS